MMSRHLPATASRMVKRRVESMSSRHPSLLYSTNIYRCATKQPLQCHWFSSLIEQQQQQQQQQPIRILYASQGGTAQLFAHQLAEAIEEETTVPDVTIQGLHESKTPPGILEPGKALHLFLVSSAGVGEPPDNSRAFFEWLRAQQELEEDDSSSTTTTTATTNLQDLNYAVFGLGNSVAHPNHYNVIGKTLDQKLEALGALRIMELGLGDDGDCIEDDFDKWSAQIVNVVKHGGKDDDGTATTTETKSQNHVEETITAAADEPIDDPFRITCLPGVSQLKDGTRAISEKYPVLELLPPTSDVVRHDLFHLQGTDDQFYLEETKPLAVSSNKLLATKAGEMGLREVKVTLPEQNDANGGDEQKSLSYETGDHLMVYPRNSDCVVQAYLDILDVHPHCIVSETGQSDAYPFPKGLTIYETLSHCVDLAAVPSPAFARFLLGQSQIDYKKEIANPRRTVLDLWHESKSSSSSSQHETLPLEDLLYNLVPMKPRYYSIASSSLQFPDEIRVAFRPIKYMTSQGRLREGVCTSYLSHQGVLKDDQQPPAIVPAVINSNPTFRLPRDPQTPVMFIAGGCGMAPIRSFVEERTLLCQDIALGPGTAYLGFRSPNDQVYAQLVQEGLEKGALTDVHVTFSAGCIDPDTCMNVSDLIREEGKKVWDHFESGGCTYLCGGARTFGAAMEKEFLGIMQTYGHMDFEAAEAYLRELVASGRLMEDLAD